MIVGNAVNEGDVCYHHNGTIGHHFTIECNKMIGRYVTIKQLFGGNTIYFLELCEVEVYAEGRPLMFLSN